MNHHYDDIRSRIPEPPRWWDEHAVPRYVAFSPREIANIYARECVLLLIACQDCGREFPVCMSWDLMDQVRHREERLAEQIKKREIHYGDPPNIYCCPAGPTMNSVPRRVLEFWRMGDNHEWVRDGALEVDVVPEWARD